MTCGACAGRGYLRSVHDRALVTENKFVGLASHDPNRVRGAEVDHSRDPAVSHARRMAVANRLVTSRRLRSQFDLDQFDDVTPNGDAVDLMVLKACRPAVAELGVAAGQVAG